MSDYAGVIMSDWWGVRSYEWVIMNDNIHDDSWVIIHEWLFMSDEWWIIEVWSVRKDAWWMIALLVESLW